MNLQQWTTLLLENPLEFANRVGAAIEVEIDDRLRAEPALHNSPFNEVLTSIGSALNEDCHNLLQADSFLLFEQQIRDRTELLKREDLPFPIFFNGDSHLTKICYTVTRVLKPEIVIETGVGYGTSTAYFLKALADNGKGHLHSIDRPPTQEGAIDYVGALVPDDLRGRWTLHQGRTKRILPQLLEQIDSRVGVFLHDSARTYRTMKFELDRILTRLKPESAILVNSADANKVFERHCSSTRPEVSCTVANVDKPGAFGIALYK